MVADQEHERLRGLDLCTQPVYPKDGSDMIVRGVAEVMSIAPTTLISSAL